MGSPSPSTSVASRPPSFSPIAAPPSSNSCLPAIEEGEFFPTVKLSSNAGDVPEFRPGPTGTKESVVSVFMGNIPPQADNRWIFNNFKTFGAVADYYVPGKVSKSSRKPFGFVRFFSLDAANRAVAFSNGAWVEGYHLDVALAKFPKKVAYDVPSTGGMAASFLSSGGPKTIDHGLGFASCPRKSFAQALLGGVNDKMAEEVRPSSSRFRVVAEVSGCAWTNVAAVANLKWGIKIEVATTRLLAQVQGLKSIRRLGVRKLFLVFDFVQDRAAALVIGDWLGLLEDVDAWCGEQVCRKKVWRVSCYGIPISAWNFTSFQSIAHVWGTLVAVEEATMNELDFSVAIIVIESEAECISDIIDLVVDGKTFPVVVSGMAVDNISGKSREVLRSVSIEDAGSAVGIPLVEFVSPVDILMADKTLHENRPGLGGPPPKAGNHLSVDEFFINSVNGAFCYEDTAVKDFDPKSGGPVNIDGSAVGSPLVVKNFDVDPSSAQLEIAQARSPISPISSNQSKGGRVSLAKPGQPKVNTFRSGFLLGSSLGANNGPKRAKFGPLSSIVLSNNRSRKVNMAARGSHCAAKVKSDGSIPREIFCTRSVENIIGVCLDEVDDEYIHDAIQREKTDYCPDG